MGVSHLIHLSPLLTLPKAQQTHTNKPKPKTHPSQRPFINPQSSPVQSSPVPNQRVPSSILHVMSGIASSVYY